MTRFSCSHLCTGEDSLNITATSSSSSLLDAITLDLTARNKIRVVPPPSFDLCRANRKKGRKTVAFAERHTSFYFVRDQPIAHIVGSPFYFNSSAGASTLFTNSTVNHDQTTVTADRPKKQRLARNHPYDQGGRVSQLRMKKTEATNLDEVVTPGLTVLGGGDTTSVVKFAWSLAADVLGTLRRETAAEDEAARLDDEEARRCACVVPGAYPAHYRRFAHGVV